MLLWSRTFLRRNGSVALSGRKFCGSPVAFHPVPDSLNFVGGSSRRYTNVYDDVFGQPGKSSQGEWKEAWKTRPVTKLKYEMHPEATVMDPETLERWYKENQMQVTGEGCPQPIFDFEHLPFIDKTKSILKSKFERPSLVQSQGWPLALTGRDLIGSAETGSGKTLTFMLPALEHVSRQKPFARQGVALPSVLVVAPTRELAVQINEETLEFLGGYRQRTACLHGGTGNKGQQYEYLSRNPQLVVATPGRLLDFMNSGALELLNVTYVVLDEADRMLDMGFEAQMHQILSQICPDRQVLLWSATWPQRMEELARNILKDPIRVKIGSGDISVNKNVEQNFYFCNVQDRLERLKSVLDSHRGQKILIFTRTKDENAFLASKLTQDGYQVDCLHGDRTQSARKSVLDDFKHGRLPILIATDIAARGLHVSDVTLVVNYSMSNNIEDYVHRIGRTGRAGNLGKSISFFTRQDVSLACDLIKLLESSQQAIPEELEKLASVYSSAGNSFSPKRSNYSPNSSNKFRRPPRYSSGKSQYYE